MLEPAAPRPRAGRGRAAGAARDRRRCSAPRRLPAAAAHGRGDRGLARRARARAARRRRRRRAAAARRAGASCVAGIGARHRRRCRACACPYRGLDEWIAHRDPARRHGAGRPRRRSLAFWPRRSAARLPDAALVAAGRRCTRCPPSRSTSTGEFLRGARAGAARARLPAAGAAAACRDAGAAAIARRRRRRSPALVVAPALDSDTPWWDYETWALDTASAQVRPRSPGTTPTARWTGRATAASCCA